MSAVDVVLCTCVVAAALAFLAWQWLHQKKQPACHTIAGPISSTKGPDVIVGASLARGLERARLAKARARSR